MQIRCTHCTKTIALAATGELPTSCPHCSRPPGPGPLGAYDPVRLIAAGGMGEVWLARHRELGTEVALKVLPAMPLDQIAGVRERFMREARLTARVQHPGVVKIHGNDVAADRPYLVLEFVAGHTLRERLRDGPLPIAEAARIAAATADVLAAAHAEGVLHRDIKPDNVMVEPSGDVRVLDFGIARAVQDDAPITRTGEIVGTPEYMAPEQLLDGPEATTERTDVHALGVLLFELLTGRSPFHGANVFQALKLVESLVPPPPSSLRTGVPAALDAVVLRALQKDPGDRIPSAREFRRALAAAVPSAAAAAPQRSSRSLWIAAVTGMLVAALPLAMLLRHHTRPAPVPDGPGANAATIAVQREAEQQALAALLADGRWWRALQDARQAAARGNSIAQQVAQDAFLLSHHAWFAAVEAPAWLARCDENDRRALFGDAVEGAETAANPRLLFGRGDAVGAARVLRSLAAREPLSRDDRRLLSLAERVAGEPLSTPDPDDALTMLLQGGDRQRFAARMPADEPEHWLAQRCAAGSDAAMALLAARNAWSYGAGEVAVLLDAMLRTTQGGSADRVPLVAPPDAEVLLRRLSVAPPDDAPASTVLAGLLDALRGNAVERARLRSLPPGLRAAAAAWLTQGSATPPSPVAVQQLAEALREH